jgi:tetratricopeptide (TPR) repeat protein
VTLEFLHRRSRDAEVVYAFKHALTQDVAYRTLIDAHRRTIHAAAGRALERFYEQRLDEVYDRLAYHYSRTDETAKAVGYLRRFAERSARAYAHVEAVEALIEAATHVDRLHADVRDRTTVELAVQRSRSLLPLGRIPEIISLLLEHRDRLARLDDAPLAARYYLLLTRVYMLADHTQVVETARRAIAEADRCGDTATIGAAYGVLAVACALSGQAVRGIEYGQQAVALLEKTSDQWSLSYAHWALGLCCTLTGAFENGLGSQRRSLAIAEAIGDPPLQLSATWGVGIMLAAMGDCDEGIAACERAVGLARHDLYRALAMGFVAFAHIERGDGEAAIAALEQSLPLIARFGLSAFEGWFTAFFAEAHRLAGRLDGAKAIAAQALDTAQAANFPIAVGWAQQSLGRIAAERGDVDAATAWLTAAVETFTAIHVRYEIARTDVDLARLWWTRGDREGARRHLEAAHAAFGKLNVPIHRARVEQLARDWAVPLSSP